MLTSSIDVVFVLSIGSNNEPDESQSSVLFVLQSVTCS